MNYYSKTKRILELCRGLPVLHIGCVGFTDMPTARRVDLAQKSLHFALTACAQTTGVDYSRESIEYLQSHKVFDNVIHGNAESLQDLGLRPEFDVVVAGDIVEHLSNPGRMLDGIRSLCHARTKVIITTPHSFGLMSFFRHMTNRFEEGQEHVFTMNRHNITNLAKRHGFQVVELATCYQEHAISRPLFKVGRAFFQCFPQLGGTLFAVLKPSRYRAYNRQLTSHPRLQ